MALALAWSKSTISAVGRSRLIVDQTLIRLCLSVDERPGTSGRRCGKQPRNHMLAIQTLHRRAKASASAVRYDFPRSVVHIIWLACS